MERIGGYTIEEELGRGGMGVVYRARGAAGRQVALKVLQTVGPIDAEFLARFTREAQVGFRLRHPGVVAVHDAGEHDGLPYLVMDLLDGPSLDHVLARDGPLDPSRAAEVAASLAESLSYLHGQGVVHRDLKPANVILTEAGPVLTDLGLVKFRDGFAQSLTASGSVLGSPNYMAPEQAQGERARIGPTTDIYGLGATLFALLTGQPPFRGGSIVTLLEAVVDQRPPRPSSLRPEIPPWLDQVCLRCLEKEPGDRYPSAQDLAQALREPGVAFGRRRSRRLQALALVVALLLTSVALGMMAAWRSSRSRPVEGGSSVTQDAAAQSEAGWEALDATRFQEAQASFARALAADPTHVSSLVGRAITTLEQATQTDADATARARADVERALELAPGDLGARTVMGRLLNRGGDGAGARVWLDRVLDDDPQYWRALYWRAFVVAKDQVDLAESDLRRAVELQPEHAPLRMDLAGFVLYHGSNPSEARELLEPLRVSGQFEGRVSAYLGEALRQEGAWEEALKFLDRAVAISPDLPDVWALRALARSAGDQKWGALADLEQALRLDPGHRLALGLLPGVHAFLGQPDLARAAVERVLEIDPAGADALIEIGQLYMEQDQPAEALAVLDRALELEPDWLRARAGRTRALELLGRNEEAIEACNWLIQRDPSASLVFKRGVLHARQGRYSEAEADMSQALEREPAHAHWYFDRANVRLDLGMRDEGRADLQRSIELAAGGRDSGFCLRQAALAEKLGDNQAVIASLRRYLELEPQDLSSWYVLAERFLFLGDYLKAEDAVRQLLLLDPDHSEGLGTFAYLSALQGFAEPTLQRLARARAAGAHPINLAAIRALLRLRLGNHQLALEESDAVLARDSAFTFPRFVRARALHGLGRLDEARLAYSEFVRLDPTHHLVPEAQQALDELGE